MRWLGNIEDPRHPKAAIHIQAQRGESQAEAWRRRKRWLVGKIIGDPRPAHGLDTLTLSRLGIVGIYELEAGDVALPKAA